MSAALRTISYGGGVQSTALGVLAAQGVIDFPVMIFSNVGDDSENPATLVYVREVFTPWAAERGVTVHEVHRRNRDGSKAETLRQHIERPTLRSIDFPLRFQTSDGSWSPGNRKCTDLYKHKVVRRWHREHGATIETPATVAIGISTDEIERLNNRRPESIETPVYPLIDLGMSRGDCAEVIRQAGLQVPPKSSCYFCPFRSPQTFAEMRRDDPETFAEAVKVEEAANVKRTVLLGKDEGRISRSGVRLADLSEAQAQLFAFDGPEGCDDGTCFT